MPLNGVTDIVIVSGARTPMAEWVGGKRGDGRPGGALASVSALELGAIAARAAIERAGITPDRAVSLRWAGGPGDPCATRHRSDRRAERPT